MIFNDYRNICNSYAIYIVLFAIAFLMNLGISSVYFYWYLKEDIICVS